MGLGNYNAKYLALKILEALILFSNLLRVEMCVGPLDEKALDMQKANAVVG
uniref:Uncharacterized protein n=1 Tax=Arundo donax TaxID=35708 RepID=A0A0A9H079_ARUDO